VEYKPGQPIGKKGNRVKTTVRVCIAGKGNIYTLKPEPLFAAPSA
jgi:hypothetical protein